MGGLELLSALNWCMAALYCGMVLFAGVATEDLRFTLMATALTLPFIVTHGYLGMSIDKGKGRPLQTVFAVISLLAFPIGTAFGVFALYACWFGESAKSFEPQEFNPAPVRARRRLLVEDPDTTPLDSAAVRRR